MGYTYSILAAVAFAVLGISYKLSDRRKCDNAQVNFFLFFSAGIMVLIWELLPNRMVPLSTAVWMGIGLGLVNAFSVIVFRVGVAKGRVSTSWTIINLSLVVPVVASMFIWHEIPKPRHYLGILLTVVAVVLLGIDIAKAGE